MYCARCGAKLPDEAKFCPRCGKNTGVATKTMDFTLKDSSPKNDAMQDAQSIFSKGDLQSKIQDLKAQPPVITGDIDIDECLDAIERSNTLKTHEAVENSAAKDKNFSEKVYSIHAEASKRNLQEPALKQLTADSNTISAEKFFKIPKNSDWQQQETSNKEAPVIDDDCPFCGAKGCHLVEKSTVTMNGSNYHAICGICGACLVGPFGALCGLCGSGTKVDIRNETWWQCLNCGKQHIASQDAREKAKMMGTSALLYTMVCSLFLSHAIWYGLRLWLLFLSLIVPPVCWFGIYSELSTELGCSLFSIFTASERRNMMIIVVSLTVAMLILGAPLLAEILGG